MVIKYMKYELKSLVRVAVIPAIVMVALAILCKISLYTLSDELVSLLLVMYFYAILAVLAVCFFFGVSRFYKSLFTGEGYMTLSLPLTASQLIWAKLLSALIVFLGGVVACVLGSFIFFIGEGETFAAFWQVIEGLTTYMSAAFSSSPILVIEVILLIIVSIPAGLLEFYLVISIGQMFTVKSRKGMTVLIYLGAAFVISIFNQTIGESLLDSMAEVSVHLYMWAQILVQAIVDVVCFLGTRYIISHKANLLV